MEAQLFQLAWQCLQQHYPELAGAILQIIGGASVLYKLSGGTNPASSVNTPSTGIGKYLGPIASIIGKIGLSK